MSGPSRVIRSTPDGWESTPRRAYKREDAGFRSVSRQVLLGDRPGEEDLRFVTRYFEVGPGGYSTLERHAHPHAVLVLRGRGRVLLDREVYDVRPFDCVYVAPDTAHQFQAPRDEALGFVCIVDRDRDWPREISEDDDDSAARRTDPRP